MKLTELSNKFYYFGFGSNLLSKRIKVLNKSAERVSAGKLVDFRLEFADTAYFSPTWNGCPATIIENPGKKYIVYLIEMFTIILYSFLRINCLWSSVDNR